MKEYPTEEDIETVKKFDHHNIIDYLDFLSSIWHWSGICFKLKGKKILHLELHTGGWSGNEEIISALMGTMFWTLYWQKSTRGGHYYFRIYPIKGKTK